MSDSCLLDPAFLRREYGQIVATLVRSYGAHRLADIEDCVQYALTQALGHWPKHGKPERPGAWLLQVAKRKLIDLLRRDARFEHDAQATEQLREPTPSTPGPRLARELQSDLLQMLYLCCDPELSPQTQMVLALKTLCGFSTQEIALRLFLSPSAVQKRLSRGRQALRERWSAHRDHAAWQSLEHPEIQSRCEAVLRLVYLLFNEGYSSIREDTPILRELCEEAIFLGNSILAHQQNPNAQALQALMLLHLSRFDARLNAQGEVLLLESQDRSLWDQGLIQAGMQLFYQSVSDEVFSRYHGEAAIALQHCLAPSYDQTNWQEITELYDLLAQLTGSPVYRLNQAIALAQLQGPSAGLALLQEHSAPAYLDSYYLWDATQGELHRQAGELDQAKERLTKALASAPQGWERKLIEARLRAASGTA